MPASIPKWAINLLKEYGHYDNPAVETDEQALLSFQQFMAEDFEELVVAMHNRSPHFDAEWGPAAERLFNVPRCGCPDYAEALEEAPATGRGSWDPGCLLSNPDVHGLRVFIDTTRRPGNVAHVWRRVKDRVFAAYREVGLLLEEHDDKSESQIHVEWKPLSGSVIGLAELPGSSASCSLSVFCRLDTAFNPRDMDAVAKLFAHELGHNCNSRHISGDPIMSPSLSRAAWNGSFSGTAFGDRLARFFGGEDVGSAPPGRDCEQFRTMLETAVVQSSLDSDYRKALKHYVCGVGPRPGVSQLSRESAVGIDRLLEGCDDLRSELCSRID